MNMTETGMNEEKNAEVAASLPSTPEDVDVVELPEEDVDSKEDGKYWSEVKETLEFIWETSETIPKKDRETKEGVRHMVKELRRAGHLNFFQSSLELAGLDEEHMHKAITDMIDLAATHDKKYFIALCTNPKVAAGESQKIYTLFKTAQEQRTELERAA